MTYKAMLPVGQWAGIAVAAAGVLYTGVLTTMMVRGVRFPPPEPYATVFHVLVLVSVLALVPLWCAIHLTAAPRKRVFTLTSLVFLAMLVPLVAANRFVALTLVRQSPGSGGRTGLVPVFRTGALERCLAVTFAVIGVLSPAAAVGLYLNSTDLMGAVAPIAWGLGPILASVLAVLWLRARQGTPVAA